MVTAGQRAAEVLELGQEFHRRVLTETHREATEAHTAADDVEHDPAFPDGVLGVRNPSSSSGRNSSGRFPTGASMAVPAVGITVLEGGMMVEDRSPVGSLTVSEPLGLAPPA